MVDRLIIVGVCLFFLGCLTIFPLWIAEAIDYINNLLDNRR